MRVYDQDEANKINAEPWQIECLSMNPSYVHWGPHEDYMWVKDGGWNSPLSYAGWSDFNITLDDLNEVVNFYFSVDRESTKCTTCDGSGYTAEAKHISDSWYTHNCQPGTEGWQYHLTQVEVDALLREGRLTELTRNGHVPTPDEVNDWAKHGRGMRHDAINHYIAVEARCADRGISKLCPDCGGDGYIYTAQHAQLGLTLWLIHPRKGASRGAEIKNITRDELPQVVDFLKQAALRNLERFAKLG